MKNKKEKELIKAVLGLMWNMVVLVLIYKEPFLGVILAFATFIVCAIAKWWNKIKDKPCITIEIVKGDK